MKIPVGCSIDRKTGERTDRYCEGTAEDARRLAEALLQAAQKSRRAGMLNRFGGKKNEQQAG